MDKTIASQTIPLHKQYVHSICSSVPLSVHPSGGRELHMVWYGTVHATVDVLVCLQGELLKVGQVVNCHRHSAVKTNTKCGRIIKLDTDNKFKT